MRRILLVGALAALVAVIGAGAARAEKPPLELAGQPFYFSATCTRIGDVILFNQSLAPRPRPSAYPSAAARPRSLFGHVPERLRRLRVAVGGERG
jgi:hypothetical protein